MRRLTWLRAAAALVVAAGVSTAFAADHIDSPAAVANPPADITDVYTWMNGNNVVLVMNVGPLATTGMHFDPTVQYVLHTGSAAALLMPETAENIICTFDASQKISCWVGTDDYVSGDASATTGLMSASGKVKVFAGLRDDPFFFNLNGFKDTVAAVEAAAGGLTFDAAGCPALSAAQSTALVGMLTHTSMGTMPPADFFAGKNVLSIVLEIDKSLLTKGGPIMSVWASTNK
jgi:hypothetical protein